MSVRATLAARTRVLVPESARPLLRYGLALGSIAAAMGLTLFAQPLAGTRHLYAAFYIASFLSAWFGGLGPGLLAVVLGSVAVNYLFLPPFHSFAIARADDLVDLVFYLIIAFTGTLLVCGQRRSRQLALRNAAVAQDRLEQLKGETFERNEAQQKLEQAEQQFALFMRHLSGAAWIKDLQGRYLYVNATGERIFHSTGELRGRTDDEIFPAETAAQFQANDRIALTLRQCHQAIETVAQEDGVRYLIVNRFPIFNADGNPIMTGGVALDVTDRRRAVEELKRSQQQLNTILESISDGFIALDRQWRFTYINRTAALQARKHPEDLLGKNMWDILPQAVGSSFQTELQRAADERVPVSFEICYHQYEQWFRIHAYPSEDGLSVFAEEITAQKQSQEAVTWLAAIVESSDDAIFGKTLEGIITSWNPAAQRLYGYTAGEILGRPISILVPPERSAEFEAIMERIRRGECVEHFETVRLRKDGTRVEVSANISPIRQPDGAIVGTSVISTDITAQKKLEQHLRQAQKLESVGVLAGGIAHEFNNLLTCVLVSADLASCEAGPDGPVRQSLNEIILASERMADLTRQMLAYAGKGKFLLERLDCSEKVREISVLVRASVPKNIELQLQLEPDLPIIQADPSQLHQLIINLIINAAEAIGDKNGAVAVRTRLHRVDEQYLRSASLVLEAVPPGHYICIEVEDNGCGMDDEIRARIFDPFFTTKLTGRGLGLSAALGIIRGHGGTLELSSAPGKGSCFRVLLPVAQDQTRLPYSAMPSRDLSGRGLVLIVDDEELIRTTARACLKQYGYAVIVAENGREALRLIELSRDQIALVLLDMTMPVMGGVEALGEIKRLAPGLPVLASTGYSEADAMRQFGRDSIAGFIQKPYTAARLAEAVKAILSLKASATRTAHQADVA